jgi:hypothetical protein
MKHLKIFEDFYGDIDPRLREFIGLNTEIELEYGYKLKGPIQNKDMIQEIIMHIEDRAHDVYYNAIDSGYNIQNAEFAKYSEYMQGISNAKQEFKKFGYVMKE